MKIMIVIMLALAVLAIGVHQGIGMQDEKEKKDNVVQPAQTSSAVFAGGCFWCTEADFEKVPGVVEAVSGYTGGRVANPNYEQVSDGGTGHVEAVKVIYDPARIGYEKLLEVFWRHVNPTDGGGQFVDRGEQYRSAIFYADENQRRLAEQSRDSLAASGRFDKPVATEILPLGEFYPAEEYHQDYYKKNPLRYRFYRGGSGRDDFLEKTWEGAAPIVFDAPAGGPGPDAAKYTVPDEATLRARLTPLQYRVTRENDTERPFENEYWDNHEPGIYVDVVSGEPLFSSLDKFESGTGWPSFTRPLEPAHIVEKEDKGFFMVRTEVRSRYGDSHLGHVFDDGPAPTGLRYCINSAALRFIPVQDLQNEGYGRYAQLFR